MTTLEIVQTRARAFLFIQIREGTYPELESGILEIEVPRLTPRVTAAGASGNTASLKSS